MKKLYLIIAFTSLSIIAYQLALMRYLSIVQFHHYAYMIISIALLGFGASGVLLFLFRNFFLNNYEGVLLVASVVCFVFILFSTSILDNFSFEPFLVFWDIDEWFNLFIFYIIIFLPFLAGATVLGLSFMKFPEVVNKLYSSNLIGSAIGGIGVLFLMFLFNPFNLNIFVAAVLLLNIALCFSFLRKNFFTILILIVIVFLFGYKSIESPRSIKFSDYKSLSYALKLPEAKIIYEKFNPEGWVISLTSPALRFAPGLSLNYYGNIPAQIGVFIDGEAIGTIISDTSANTEFLSQSTLALPYLFKAESVLVVNAGTGTEVIRAIEKNASYVLGIEVNSLLCELANKYLEKFISNKEEKKVKILNVENRAFIKQTEEKFNLIYFPLMEGFSSSAAGYYSLFENYLFTVESVSDAINKLEDNGLVCINTWTNYPPRHAIKLFSLVISAFVKSNISPFDKIIVIRSWSTVTLIAKRSEFTSDEILKVKNFCTERNFDFIYYPGIKIHEANQYNILKDDIYYIAFQKFLSGEQNKFEKDYFFNIQAPTDEQPYFSNFLKIKNFISFLSQYGKENFPLYEYGYLLLLITFVQIFFMSGFFIIIPMLFIPKQSVNLKSKFKVLLYFSGIGFGFMFIEILLIQKFVLFLSHPIYSVSMVISSILFFAGIGSMISQRTIAKWNYGIKAISLSLISLIVVYYFLLPIIFNLLLHLPVTLKYSISFLIIAPLAILMGMFFPLGIKNLSQNYEKLIPWAWGVNGAVSVLGSVLAPIVSIELGFKFLMFFSCLAYGIILVVDEKFK